MLFRSVYVDVSSAVGNEISDANIGVGDMTCISRSKHGNRSLGRYCFPGTQLCDEDHPHAPLKTDRSSSTVQFDSAVVFRQAFGESDLSERS